MSDSITDNTPVSTADTSVQQTDALFDLIFTKLVQMGTEKKLLSLPDFVAVTMVVVNTVEQLTKQSKASGVDKKQLAIHLIKKLVSLIPEAQLNAENRGLVNVAIDQLLPSLIDGLVAAQNSQLFHKLEKSASDKAKSGCNCFGK